MFMDKIAIAQKHLAGFKSDKFEYLMTSIRIDG